MKKTVYYKEEQVIYRMKKENIYNTKNKLKIKAKPSTQFKHNIRMKTKKGEKR